MSYEGGSAMSSLSPRETVMQLVEEYRAATRSDYISWDPSRHRSIASSEPVRGEGREEGREGGRMEGRRDVVHVT